MKDAQDGWQPSPAPGASVGRRAQRRLLGWVRRRTRAATFAALSAARRQARRVPHFNLRRDRYVILSDTHKGDRTPVVDEFLMNEALYCDALAHYLDEDFRLVLNGDIEEGWKSAYPDVVAAYRDSAIALEREFAQRGPDHYLRIYGNHDIDLAQPDFADHLLTPVMGQPVGAHAAVLLGDQIIIAHGHQGDFSSERFSWFSRRVVQYLWRPLQRSLRLPWRYRAVLQASLSERDRLLAAWARASRLLLIAGHTHQPVMVPAANDAAPAYRRHYLNGGCCVYEQALTGVEIDRGEIRLVKWETTPGGRPRRDVLQSTDLGPALRRL